MPSKLNNLLNCIKMAFSLTCCPGTPWWAAGHCQRPGLRCLHFPHLRFPSPEPRCLPSAWHSLLCEAGSYRREEKEAFNRVSLCKYTPQQCRSMFLPDREDPAEIIHDIVEFNLQVFEDIAGLHTQLKYIHENTRLIGVSRWWWWWWGEGLCSINDTNGHILLKKTVWMEFLYPIQHMYKSLQKL